MAMSAKRYKEKIDRLVQTFESMGYAGTLEFVYRNVEPFDFESSDPDLTRTVLAVSHGRPAEQVDAPYLVFKRYRQSKNITETDYLRVKQVQQVQL